MNFLLHLNKKFILLIFFILITLTIWIVFLQPKFLYKELIINSEKKFTYDIINPKFTIDNDKNNIIIKANEGNFINENKILLKNEVNFVSKKFKIESSEVFFDKKNQTAYSENHSIFSSKKTEINSKGFEIKDAGNKIIFNGKTIIKITK